MTQHELKMQQVKLTFIQKIFGDITNMFSTVELLLKDIKISDEQVQEKVKSAITVSDRKESKQVDYSRVKDMSIGDVILFDNESLTTLQGLSYYTRTYGYEFKRSYINDYSSVHVERIA